MQRGEAQGSFFYNGFQSLKPAQLEFSSQKKIPCLKN